MIMSPTTSLLLCGSLTVAASSVVALPAIPLSSIAAGIGGFAIEAESADDFAGFSVSGAGDVNGDGIPDVIVGAYRAPDWSYERGRAYVVFGKTTSSVVQLSAVAAGTGGFVINGKLGDRAGFSVSGAGDVNGDGRADVIVGAIFTEGPVGPANAGGAYVVFGKSSGTPVECSALGAAGFVIHGEAPQDRAGESVAGAGDVNGDGLADVILGARYLDAISFKEGRAYLVFGKTTTTAVPLSAVAAGVGGFAINGEVGSGQFGLPVAGAGDVNGDGLNDVVVAAKYANAGGTQRGRTYVVFGKTGGALVQGSDVSAGTGGGFAISGEANNQTLGRGLAGAGDVNGDGLADLLIGSAFGTPGGRGYVAFGKSTFTAIAASSLHAGTGGFSIQGHNLNDSAGDALAAAGDTDGDGFFDILIGAPDFDEDGAGAGVFHGRGYMVLGKATTASVFLSAVGAGNGGLAMPGVASSDLAGSALSGVGDMNGDGMPDYIVGAHRTDTNGTNAGTAYVVFSNATPPVQGLYRQNQPSGNAPRAGIGTQQVGGDSTQWADGRAFVDFADGTGPGINGASRVTVGLRRTDSGSSGLPAGVTLAHVANARWSLSTDRTTASPLVVGFRYLNSEVAGLAESDLRVYTSASISGPWTLLGGQSVDVVRNTVSATIPTLGVANNFFLLIGVPDNGDADNDGVRTIADYTAIRNQVAGFATLPAGGDGDVDNDGDVDLADAALLLDHLANGTPLP